MKVSRQKFSALIAEVAPGKFCFKLKPLTRRRTSRYGQTSEALVGAEWLTIKQTAEGQAVTVNGVDVLLDPVVTPPAQIADEGKAIDKEAPGRTAKATRPKAEGKGAPPVEAGPETPDTPTPGGGDEVKQD